MIPPPPVLGETFWTQLKTLIRSTALRFTLALATNGSMWIALFALGITRVIFTGTLSAMELNLLMFLLGISLALSASLERAGLPNLWSPIFRFLRDLAFMPAILRLLVPQPPLFLPPAPIMMQFLAIQGRNQLGRMPLQQLFQAA